MDRYPLFLFLGGREKKVYGSKYQVKDNSVRDFPGQ